MPKLKKTPSEVGSLGDLNRRLLLRSRMLLLRDMDVNDILEFMSSDDGFRSDIRAQIQNFPTRDQRVACFLDRLHSCGDSTFALFMDALKEHYKHIHFCMGEMIKDLKESDAQENPRKEKVALSGEAVRKLLRSNLHKADSDIVNSESIDGSLDVEIHLDEKEEEDYIDCYAIPMRGRQLQEPWIKHSDYVSRQETESEAKSLDSYMAALIRNVMFKQIDLCDIPEQVKRPSKYCNVYVVDPNQEIDVKRSESVKISAQRQLSIKDTVEHFVFESLEDDDDIPSTTPPPPVPPKPENLPPLSSVPRLSVSEDECPPPPTSSPPRIESPSQEEHKDINVNDIPVPPPVPLPKPKLEDFTCTQEAVPEANEETQEVEKPLPPIPADAEEDDDENEPDGEAEREVQTVIMRRVKEIPIAVSDFPVEEPSESKDLAEGDSKEDEGRADNSELAEKAECKVDEIYYSSTCSTISTHTLTADCNQDSKKELLDIEEECYEPITPTLDTTQEEGEELYEDDQDRISPQRQDGSNHSIVAHDESSKASGDSLDCKSNVTTDSGVEVPLTIPPRRASRASVKRLPLLPQNLSDVNIAPNDLMSDSDSYYEDIDQLDRGHSPSMLSSTSYLDPRSYIRSSDKKSDRFKDGRFAFTAIELEISKRILLKKDDHLIAETCEVFIPTQEVPKDCSLHNYLNVSLAYDKSGNAFYAPTNLLKQYGDPEGEPWFYPIPLSSRQATLFLSAENQEGCFVVYRPLHSQSNAAYNLSVCRRDGDVVHYHIIENAHGDVMIRSHDHSFMNIQNLVQYFQRNKSQLATRLRRPLKEAHLPIIPGYHFDSRYELSRSSIHLTGKIIGKGHFGVVCSATYRGSDVAVKVLQRNDISTMDEDDFLEEAKVMMGLRHEHVVRLIGVCCTAKSFFIVTELVALGSLKDCLRQNRLPTENIDTLFDLCIQVTAALYYLETQKFIIHRDVAARNFLLTNDMCVKLSDFGRARYVTDDNYQAAKSEKISIKWAAPEVLLNSTYSTKADVWSLGVVYWEIFSAGCRPYSEMSSEQATMYVIEGGRLDKPVGCSPDLYSIMKQCWREKPEERPSFTSLYDKFKSKSSIYYVRTVRAEKTTSLPISPSVRVAPSNQPKTPSSARPHSMLAPKTRKTALSDSRLDDGFSEEYYGRKSSSHTMQHSPSSSEMSLSSQNQIDLGKDDMDRGGLIRKSLRKMMKKSKKKTSKIDLRESFYSPT